MKKYIVFVVFLAVLLGVVKSFHFDDNIDTLLENISSTPLPAISDLISWYRSAAFVDKNLFTDYSGVFPDLDDFAQHEMTWLANTWSFWAGGVGLGLPFVIFFLFQVYRRIKDRKHFPLSLDENGLVIYREIHRQVHRAYWRANNHNFEKSFFLVSLLGIFLFGVQFLLQPFVMLSHNLLISVLVSFMVYATLVYFFYIFWHRFDQSRVIRIIDQEMDLRQSLSTALEVGEDYHSSSLYLYLLKETKERLCRDNILRLFPRKFPRINSRNLGITTFFMGMTIFLVSVALPVMALVYNNLRSGLFASPDNKAVSVKVENVILEESSKIRVLIDLLDTKKELSEFEPVVKELSDLSRKLDKIVRDDEEINDIQVLTTGAKRKTEKKWLTEGGRDKKDEDNSQEMIHTIQDKKVVAGQDLNQHLALQLNVLIKDLIRYNLEKKDGKYPASSVVNTVEKALSSADIIPAPNISHKTLSHTRKPDSGILSSKGKRAFSSVKKDVKKLRKLTAMLTDIQYQLDQFQLEGSSEHEGLSWKEKPEKLSAQDRLNQLSQKLLDNDKVSPSDDRKNQSFLDRENRLIPQASDKQEQGQTVLDSNTPEQVSMLGIEDAHLEPWSEPSPGEEEPHAGDRQGDPSAHLRAQRKKDDPKEAIELERNTREMESGSMKDQYPDEKAEKDIAKKISVKVSRLNRKNNRVSLLKLNQKKPVILPESKGSESLQPESSSSAASYPNVKLPVGGGREALQDRNPKNNLMEAKQNNPDIKRQKVSGKKHPDKNTDGGKSKNMVKNQPGESSDLKKKFGGDLLLQRSSALTPVKNQDWERVQKEERTLELSSQSTEKNSTGSLYGSDEDADKEEYAQKIVQPTSIKFFREELTSRVNDCIHLGETIEFREGIQKNILQLKQFRNKIVSVTNPMDIDGIPQNALDPMKRIEDARMIKNKPAFSMGRSVVNPKDINELSSDIRLISDNLKGTVAELESGVYDHKIASEVQKSPKNAAFRRTGNSNSTSQAYNGKFPGRVIDNNTINPNKSPYAYSGNKSPKTSLGTINVGGAKTRPKMNANLIGEVVDDLKNLYTQVRDMGKFTPPKGSRILNNRLFLASGDELDQIEHLQERIRQEDNPSNVKNLANDLVRLTRQMGSKGFAKGLGKPKITTFESPALASLVRDIDRIKEQIRIEKNPSQLQDLSAELARRIMELHARSLEQDAQNSNKQQQTTSLSQQISELASRMNSEENEINLKNLSAEFIQQAESYSKSAQSAGIPPENPQGSANKHSQFTQFKKDLQKQTNQMRRESSPRNLRNSASRIAQNIRKFEIRNRLYVDPLNYNQESLEEMDTYRLAESRNNSLKSHLSPEVTKTEKTPRDRQKPRDKENPVLIGRDQLAYLAQNIQDLASKMQNNKHQKDMENLKDDILDQTEKYMLLTLGRGTREERVDKMRFASDNQLMVPVGRLQQGKSAEPVIAGKRMHPESREPNSGKGIPDDYPMQAGENLNTLRRQMERLTDQLQVDKNPTQRKQVSQGMVKTANQFQNQISGSIPNGQTGTTNLQMLEGLSEQKRAGQNLNEEGRRLAKLNSRLDLLSSNLRQETNPNRLRKLSKDTSRLVSRIQDLNLDNSRNDTKQQLSRIGKNLSGLANDPFALDSENKRSEVSNDLKLQAKELRKLSQRTTNPEDRKELAIAADRALQISQTPKRNIQSVRAELADLSRKILNQASSLKNRPNPVNLKARDNLFSKFSNLSERIRSERNRDKLTKLKDQLVDNLSQIQDRFLKKTRPEKIDRVAGNTQKNLGNTRRLIPNKQDDSLKTGGKQKKRQYSLSEGKDRSDDNSYSEEKFISSKRTIDRARKSLTDISSQIQNISDKIQKEKNPQKIKKFQKQLVVLNQRMIETLQKNISYAQKQLPGSSFTTKRREQLYEQMQTLSQKLSKAGKDKQLNQISNHLDRLASNILSMKENISTDRIKKRSPKDSDKNRVNDKKEVEKIEGKSTSAINVINKAIKKLNTYRISKKRKNRKMTTSNEDDRGAEGIKNKQLMMADRFEADKITKDTDVIPEAGVVRNMLSMEKNLHRDDVLERIIRRLEMNKKQIKKAARVTEEKDVLDYSSDIAISRKAAKQPPGLENIRYSPKAKVVIGSPKKNIEKEYDDEAVSAMSSDPRFSSVRFKMEDFKDQYTIPMQEIQSKKDKNVRLSPFQQTVDSVDEDTIPHIYQNILRQLFSDKEKSVKEARR